MSNTLSISKTCSFFGHRNIDLTDKLKQKVKDVVKDLITNKNVSIFLFGSRSDFDSLCHLIVTELKEEFPNIKRFAYTCRNETCILESEKQKWEKIYSRFEKQEVHLLGVEEERNHKTKYVSGKASYVERNQAMINNSDFCVFYYDDKYLPQLRKHSKRSVSFYQPKSGTAIAYTYAKQKKKAIINIFTKMEV